MKMLLLFAALAAMLCAAVGPAQASIASDAGAALVDFAKDTLTAPDTVGFAVGDPLTLNFSRKATITSIPGLAFLDIAGGLGIAASGPAVRAQVEIGLTNIKGNRISLVVLTRPYDGATWRIPLGEVGRIGLEPRVALSRAF